MPGITNYFSIRCWTSSNSPLKNWVGIINGLVTFPRLVVSVVIKALT
jgi:hypothetical protein